MFHQIAHIETLGLTRRVKMPIGINTTVAMSLHKDKIRQARAPKLAELDIEFQRALEVGAATSSIVAKKQALRDAPAAVDSLVITETSVAGITTQLKACWDTNVLGPNPL